MSIVVFKGPDDIPAGSVKNGTLCVNLPVQPGQWFVGVAAQSSLEGARHNVLGCYMLSGFIWMDNTGYLVGESNGQSFYIPTYAAYTMQDMDKAVAAFMEAHGREVAP